MIPMISADGSGRYDFTSLEAQRLSDLTGIASDLEAVLRICAGVMDDSKKDGTQPTSDVLKWMERRQTIGDLVCAAVVRYARTLGTGVRMGIPSLWLEELTQELQASNIYFRALRDRWIAHSVNPLEDNQVFVWLASTPAKTLAVSHISVDRGRFWPGDDDAARLSQLARVLLTRAEVEIAIETERLLAIAREMPIAEILRRSSEPLPIPTTALVGHSRSKPVKLKA